MNPIALGKLVKPWNPIEYQDGCALVVKMLKYDLALYKVVLKLFFILMDKKELNSKVKWAIDYNTPAVIFHGEKKDIYKLRAVLDAEQCQNNSLIDLIKAKELATPPVAEKEVSVS